MNITIKIVYSYFNDDEGVFKRVVLKKKNLKTSKSEADVDKLQIKVQEELEEDGHLVELGGGSDEAGPLIYDFELTEQFEVKEEASEIAHRLLDLFCEKTMIKK